MKVFSNPRRLFVVTSLLTSVFIGSIFVAPLRADGKKDSVPPVMYEFLSHILALEPYIYSEEKFVADENKQFVSQQLSEFSKLSEKLKKHKRLTTTGFRIPAAVIVKQLHEVSENYDNGHRNFAWSSLRSTLNSCSQCHTQVSKKMKTPEWSFDSKALPKDTMELGSFWYMIRSYDKADAEFTKVINQFDEKNSDPFKLRAALKYVLSIDLRIKQSPELGLKRLLSIKNEKFPMYLRKEIDEWKNELLILREMPKINIQTALTSTVETYCDSIFRAVYPIALDRRSKFIAMEYASGLLYQFVNTRPIETTQRMLFWLGISNNEVDRFEITSYGSSYLKECIENYPPSPISQQCYRELEDNWIFGFSGSAGSFLPEQYKSELKRLKRQVDSIPDSGY